LAHDPFPTRRSSDLQPFVSNVRGDQHEPSPFLQYRRSSASVGSALPSPGRSVFVSRLTSSAIGSQASLPAGPMRVPESTLVETRSEEHTSELQSGET